MLTKLQLTGIGPAPRIDLELGPRLNVLTGDNGLGKSFVLDVAWWALTGTWADHRTARPREEYFDPPATRRGRGKALGEPSIAWEMLLRNGRRSRAKVDFDFHDQSWPWRTGRPPLPGLTLYVRVDGSFSLWDPARNHRRDEPGRLPAFHFTPEAVWDGFKVGSTTVCNGLIRDWVSWQRQDLIEPKTTSPFARLRAALETLSPHPGQEWLRPGPPTRLSVGDALEHPTLEFPYGRVPAVNASAGIRRILGLAYLVIWAWNEHLAAARLLRQQPESRFILLMDEVETHLHPQWQRRIVPALLKALEGLEQPTPVQVQALLTTHSPMVLASLEPLFSPEKDRLFLFDLKDHKVRLREMPWAKYGNAQDWLTSTVFGLEQARSLDAERAIEAAEAFMRKDPNLPQGLDTWARINAELRRVLPGDDEFWARWVGRGKARGRR